MGAVEKAACEGNIRRSSQRCQRSAWLECVAISVIRRPCVNSSSTRVLGHAWCLWTVRPQGSVGRWWNLAYTATSSSRTGDALFQWRPWHSRIGLTYKVASSQPLSSTYHQPLPHIQVVAVRLPVVKRPPGSVTCYKATHWATPCNAVTDSWQVFRNTGRPSDIKRSVILCNPSCKLQKVLLKPLLSSGPTRQRLRQLCVDFEPSHLGKSANKTCNYK